MIDVQIFPNLPLPIQCLAGLREELFLVGDTEVARTVNGRSMILAMPWGQKYGLRYTIDGDGRRLFPLDDLPLGRPIRVHAATPRSKLIPPGGTIAPFDRKAVPGSVHARDVDTGEVVPVGYEETDTEVFRLIGASIFGRAGWTQVYYRPVLDCLVTGVVGFGSDVTGRRQNATVELEEEMAP